MENKHRIHLKKAAKRLHFLKILEGYNAPCENLKTFYTSAIRSILEHGTKIWHGSLTEEQSKNIEQIQRRGMKTICPEKTYEQALIECGMETLENRRDKMCIKLINDIYLINSPKLRYIDHKIDNIYNSI